MVIVDAQTFLIPSFNYDGQAPDAHFWVGTGERPGPEGMPRNIVVKFMEFMIVMHKIYNPMSLPCRYICGR